MTNGSLHYFLNKHYRLIVIAATVLSFAWTSWVFHVDAYIKKFLFLEGFRSDFIVLATQIIKINLFPLSRFRNYLSSHIYLRKNFWAPKPKQDTTVGRVQTWKEIQFYEVVKVWISFHHLTIPLLFWLPWNQSCLWKEEMVGVQTWKEI